MKEIDKKNEWIKIGDKCFTVEFQRAFFTIKMNYLKTTCKAHASSFASIMLYNVTAVHDLLTQVDTAIIQSDGRR
jgi:hypothetical protein